MYAFGLDRGGSTIAYSAFTIIFMREHNRIARLLASENRDWAHDDNRLFETARLINIRQLLTIVVNDYIRHIAGVFPLSLDRTFAEKKRWYRTNRISIEFNLLYRWHSLVPDTFTLAGTPLEHQDYRFNNRLVEEHGVERIISDASSQRAGRIGLFNTPRFMDVAEQHGLKWARDFGVRPFNDYRKRFGFSRYSSIDDFADGPEVAEALKRVYNNRMDDVEFTVGLFAEKRAPDQVMPDTLRIMVAYDAFTHILTNPILSSEVHCPETFSNVGWKLIQQKATLEQLIKRNCDESKLTRVSLAI
jgi:prostaglandin-endoperoxide synthase 2